MVIMVLWLVVPILVLVGIPYLLFSQWRLKQRLADLEQLVKQQQNPIGVDRTSDRVAPDTMTPEKVAPDDGGAAPFEPPAAPVRPQPGSAPVAARQAVQGATAQRPPVDLELDAFTPDFIDRFIRWLRENWVLAIAATSLALAGVFMVQYGVENGLLTPFWRVMGACAFGIGLIAAGEFIRRRAGNALEDGDAVGATRFLPSTLSGAGIVVLYAAIFAARALYGLISPITMLAGLSGVSAVSLVLGWFYGPVLAGVGILGASVAPFITGSSSANAWVIHYYLVLVAMTGLGIDTIKRWAWVSVVTLSATLAGNWLLYFGNGAELHFLAASLLIAFAAIAIPERGLIPRQAGEAFLNLRVHRSAPAPAFPTWLSMGAVLAATGAALVVHLEAATPDGVWLVISALSVLIVATTLWTRDAPALFDHVVVPALALLAVIMLEAFEYGPLFRAFQHAGAGTEDLLQAPLPNTVWVLSALGATTTLLMFLRMQWAVGDADRRPLVPTFWALCAAVFAPAMLLVLELTWAPGDVLGQYPWALVVIAMAALLVLLAMRASAADDAGRPMRVGLFAVGALTLITLAIFLVLTRSALTVALATMVLATVLLDRRHALPPLAWFIQIGVAIITWRLVVWPGFDWAMRYDYGDGRYLVSYPEFSFAFLATLALLAAAWWIARGKQPNTALVLESGAWTIFGVFLVVTLMRIAPRGEEYSHYIMGLTSTIWIALALNQLYRMQGGGRVQMVVRAVLVALYGFTATGALAVLFFAVNPLLASGAVIVGPPIFDSLMLAYLPLAAAFAIAAWKIRQFGQAPRIAFVVLSVAFTAIYIGSEIRRLWRGRNLSVPGFTDPELYSYTLAMLVASVALLIFAFDRRSHILRKIAMAGVALTVAKVFLVDMSGLSGLIRVFSFMGLGLSLVGLAWLNRKMTAQWENKAPKAGRVDR